MSTPPPSQRRGRLKKTPSRSTGRSSSARKSVRFAGAAEIPFVLGSPVAFHLAGHTPQQWKNRTRSVRHRAVVQELKARELDVPSTPAAALALLHTEYCKELLATLESRGMMSPTVSAACREATTKNPRATLQRLRGMLRMANHLSVSATAMWGPRAAPVPKHVPRRSVCTALSPRVCLCRAGRLVPHARTSSAHHACVVAAGGMRRARRPLPTSCSHATSLWPATPTAWRWHAGSPRLARRRSS